MQFIALSSSHGTTFQSILDRITDGSLTAKCLGLITDRADRGCIEKAKAAGIPYSIVEHRDGETRESYCARLHQAILSLISAQPDQPARPDKPLTGRMPVLLALMGWMWILTPAFIAKHRILNVHPALLPKYGGKGMYGHRVHEAVLAAGDKESGITIHLVDNGVDTGKILLQKTCPMLQNDTPATLQARVQELEKEWYPKCLQMIEEGMLL